MNHPPQDQILKEYVWPHSFPDCTPALRTVVNRWIKHHYSRTSRAKCLILIGRRGIGKTTFAQSLPGQYNYFHDQWKLDDWHDSARYSIFDNIAWDQFDDNGYPNKKCLLTQNGWFNATDQSGLVKQINNRQPAIVLLTSGHSEGSLTAEPITNNDRFRADYWSKRATVYRMGPDEYFYKPITSTIASNNEPIGKN